MIRGVRRASDLVRAYGIVGPVGGSLGGIVCVVACFASGAPLVPLTSLSMISGYILGVALDTRLNLTGGLSRRSSEELAQSARLAILTGVGLNPSNVKQLLENERLLTAATSSLTSSPARVLQDPSWKTEAWCIDHVLPRIMNLVPPELRRLPGTWRRIATALVRIRLNCAGQVGFWDTFGFVAERRAALAAKQFEQIAVDVIDQIRAELFGSAWGSGGNELLERLKLLASQESLPEDDVIKVVATRP